MQVEVIVKDDKAQLFLETLKEFRDDMIEKFRIVRDDGIEIEQVCEDEEDYALVKSTRGEETVSLDEFLKA